MPLGDSGQLALDGAATSVPRLDLTNFKREPDDDRDHIAAADALNSNPSEAAWAAKNNEAALQQLRISSKKESGNTDDDLETVLLQQIVKLQTLLREYYTNTTAILEKFASKKTAIEAAVLEIREKLNQLDKINPRRLNFPIAEIKQPDGSTDKPATINALLTTLEMRVFEEVHKIQDSIQDIELPELETEEKIRGYLTGKAQESGMSHDELNRIIRAIRAKNPRLGTEIDRGFIGVLHRLLDQNQKSGLSKVLLFIRKTLLAAKST